MEWIDLAQERDRWRVLVNTVMNLRVSYNAGKFLSSCATGGLSMGLVEISRLVQYAKC
jgi:hypothetical protein